MPVRAIGLLAGWLPALVTGAVPATLPVAGEDPPPAAERVGDEVRGQEGGEGAGDDGGERAGEAAPAPAAEVADRITVAARREEPREEAAAAVTVRTREELARIPARDMAEVLDHVPGVRVLFSEPWGTTPIASARGFFGGGEAGYLQLRVDGVPLADAESGVADWRRVRVEDVERVEVLRGGGSSLYGDTALGGVVRVVTRHGDAPGTGGGAAVGIGSFDTATADLSLRWGGRLPLGVAASAGRSDGFRDHSASERVSASVALRGSLPLGRAGAGEVGRAALRFDLAAEGRDAEEPGTLAWDGSGTSGLDLAASDPLFRFDREETDRLRAALGAGGLAAGRIEGAARLWAETRDTEWLRTLRLAPGFADRAHRRLDGERLGLVVEGAAELPLAGRAGRLSGGLEAARESFDTLHRAVGEDGALGEPVAAAEARRVRLGGFLSQSWHPTRRLRLDLGLRWDSIDDRREPGGGAPAVAAAPADGRSEALSPRLAANLRLGPEEAPWILHLRLARSFKAATLDQLLDPRPLPGPGGGSFTLSNPDISPQRSRGLEAGVSRSGRWGRFELVGYRTRVDDEIDFDPVTFRLGNVGETSHRGAEAAVRLRPEARVSPWAELGWTRVEPLGGANAGNQLKNIPERRIRAGLSARLAGKVTAHLQATRLSGRWYLDDANTVALPRSTVVDLRLARRLGRFRLTADLLNVTDEEWLEVGVLLAGFDGSREAFVLPASGAGARLILAWER